MTIANPVGGAVRTFGLGGTEPYSAALLAADRGDLHLVDLDSSMSTAFDVARWCEVADPADQTMLLGATGPVLDVGCGPGRMVRAALDRGLPTLGVDVSSAAVRLARAAGLPVLERSIFDPVPHAEWSTVLLADGNIGIGGDPVLLLRRCAGLLARAGAIIVELAPDPAADRRFRAQVRDGAGGSSAEFPWAEVGEDAIGRLARAAGLSAAQPWSAGLRRFSRLTVTSM